MDRIASLQLSRLEGFQGVPGSWQADDAGARQLPRLFRTAFATSERITRAGDLMRTQTEMIIQRQNRDLLQSMNERAQHQLRLQQTVERLSVAAVTYYGVGLSAILPVAAARRLELGHQSGGGGRAGDRLSGLACHPRRACQHAGDADR